MRIDKIAAECIDFIFMYHYLRCPKKNLIIFVYEKALIQLFHTFLLQFTALELKFK